MNLDSSATTSIRRLAALALALAFLYGCAATPPAEQDVAGASEDDPLGDLYGEEENGDDGANDPLEIPNRFIFAINGFLDFIILKPVSYTYKFWVPDPVRESIGNFLNNISSPVILANDLFQGEFDRAETTLTRFAINTTAGLLGFRDPATDWGYERHTEDFGQTLATYGTGEGFYLMLPLLGPSSARDGTGKVVDIFLDPLTYLAPQNVRLARFAADGIQFRSDNYDAIEDLERDSLDFYAAVRSVWRQNREYEIRNGAPAEDAPVPEMDEMDEMDEMEEPEGTEEAAPSS
jgi:phospholipid-binding lipoprotein MlaA